MLGVVMNELCVHILARYEPFIVYAVESVVKYANKILLYDTGSRDAEFPDYTISDCEMLANKYPDKVVFKEFKTEDETPWNLDTLGDFKARMAGKSGKGAVRKKHIEDTDPNEFSHFLVVDADEIYYEETIAKIKNTIINENWGKILNYRVPLIWYYDKDTYFDIGHTGRIFITKKTDMHIGSPGEMHCEKGTGSVFNYSDGTLKVREDLKYVTHWETYLKRWRRPVDKSLMRSRKEELPEVMIDDMSYFERFEKELKGPREEYYKEKQKKLFGSFR
jgi:hypothetical protein